MGYITRKDSTKSTRTTKNAEVMVPFNLSIIVHLLLEFVPYT
jgi:hypothetical protein